MRRGDDVPAPSGTELRAAAFAAAAESGIVFLPAHLILADVAELGTGTTAALAAFAVGYVAAVVLVCRFRASSQTTAVAAMLGAAGGLWAGWSDLAGALIGVVIGLLIVLRAVTLALRDWREPIHASIGVGAVVLGLEVLVASGAVSSWRPPLLAIVPAFFVGSLASRAVVVWGAEEDEQAERADRSWIRSAAGIALGLMGAMAAGALLAVRGGLFERLGAWLSPLGNLVLSVVVGVLWTLFQPVAWALRAVGVNPDALRKALEEWRERAEAAEAAGAAGGDGSPWSARLFGLAVFLLIAWALFRSIRRLRTDVGAFERRGISARRSRGVPLPEDDAALPARRPLRRELPSDTVRRWYAEALIALRDRGVAREPSLTPAELVPRVAEDFPDVAETFRALTRMYEDVRYGNRHVSADTIHAAEPGVRDVLAAFRRSP